MSTKRLEFTFLLGMLLCVQRAQSQLFAHAEVIQSGNVFTYTLLNDEPVGSPNFLSLFDLFVNAPIIITGVPLGWEYITDNHSYVDWFNADSTLPYPHDVAPGASLGGFVIESNVSTTDLLDYGLTAWDHVADISGPDIQGFVLAPSGGIAGVPEPRSAVFLASLVLPTALALRSLRRRQSPRSLL